MSTGNPGAYGTRMDLPASDLHCEHCWQSYTLHDKKAFATAYFRDNARLDCQDCGKPIDWWESTLKSIKKNEVNTAEEICLPIEARRSFLETTLRANQITEVIFADTGIPADALILNIHYNTSSNNEAPQGSLQAVEIYQNSMERRINPLGAKFYGIPQGEPPYPDAGLLVGVMWAPRRPDDLAWEFLVNAFRYYLEDRYDGALISANIAVEALLGGIVEDSTYNNQLNVLLPRVVSDAGAPPLPDHLRELLNRLRRVRNSLGHGEITAQAISNDEAAEMLCAAVFGIRYLEVVEPYL